jgi:hypothetical protein
MQVVKETEEPMRNGQRRHPAARGAWRHYLIIVMHGDKETVFLVKKACSGIVVGKKNTIFTARTAGTKK